MKFQLGKKGRWITLAVFIVLSIIGVGLSTLAKINYDMREYLSDDSITQESLTALEREFGALSSMIQIMVEEDVDESLDPKNAKEDFKESLSGAIDEIEKIELVNTIVWLGTFDGISDLALETQGMKKSDYYNEGRNSNNYLITIEFTEDDYSLNVGEAIVEIKDILKSKGFKSYYRGAAIMNQFSRDVTKRESALILGVVVPIAIVILFLASASWLEPVVVLINLWVGIFLNMGTNFILPHISFVTIAIASVLQLAMSLDYSLFMVHRYYENRDNGLEPIEAANLSLKQAFKSVTASALTTIAGFLALIFMRYTIGTDIGVSLAKAIFMSYAVTLLLMPALLVIFDKPLLKHRHKQFMPRFKKITGFQHKFRFAILAFIVILGGVSIWGSTKTKYAYGDTPNNDPNQQIFQDRQKIVDNFGEFEPILVIYKDSDKDRAASFATEVEDLEEVAQVQGMYQHSRLFYKTFGNLMAPGMGDMVLDKFEGFEHEDKDGNIYRYERMIIMLNIAGESDEMYALTDKLTALADENFGRNRQSDEDIEYYMVGVPVATSDIKETVLADGVFVQLISAIVIAIVICFALKSLFVPIILVVLIEISIFINMAFTAMTGGVVAYIGYLVISSLQLGATIDYAVLLTSRYQEFREEDKKPKEAMFEAMTLSSPAIITSAVVLSVAGFMEAIISQLAIVSEIGLLVGRGALISGLLVLFVLPALLMIFDKPIMATSFSNIAKIFKKKDKKEKKSKKRDGEEELLMPVEEVIQEEDPNIEDQEQSKENTDFQKEESENEEDS